MRYLLTLLLTGLYAAAMYAATPLSICDYDRDAVKARLDATPLHSIEGIWQFTTDGATVVIERDTDSGERPTSDTPMRYRMVIMRSPVRSVLPGTVMGYLSPTAKRGSYSATIFTDSDGGSRLLKPKKFTLTLTDDSHLGFHKHGLKIKVRFWRLLPYISRLGISTRDDSPRDLDGCIRIYPMPVTGPVDPIYL